MMLLKRLRLAGGLMVAGFALAAVYGLFGSSTHAFAISGAGIMQSGSFSGGSTIPPAIPWSVDTAAEFEALISNELYAQGYGTTAGSNYNMYGAAYIVESMLPTGVVNGMNDHTADDPLVWQARSDFGAWSALINSYEAAGRINWGVSTTLPAGTRNTLHQCTSSCSDLAAWSNSGGIDAHWFRVFINPVNEPSTLLVFTNPDGSSFQIRRECANIVGWSTKLTNLPWSMSGRTTVDNSTPFPGQTIHFSHYLQDTGQGPTTQDIWYAPYNYNASNGTGSAAYGGQDSGQYTLNQEKQVTAPTDTVTVPAGTPGGTKICQYILFQPVSSSNGGTGTGLPVCATVQDMTPACGAATTNPATFDPTDPYTINAYVNYPSAGAASYVKSQSGFYIYVWDSSWSTKMSYVDSAPATVSGSTINASFSAPPLNQAGNFNIAYGISGPAGSIDCHGSFRVSYTPYFSVSGGDVSAGPGFGTACTPQNSSIKANNLGNTGSGSSWYGAGTQLGAFSLNQITGFATNTVRNSGSQTTTNATGGNVSQPSGLAFANASTSSTVWGTTFGKDPVDDPADNPSSCVPDYYAQVTSGTPAPTVLSSSGTYIMGQAQLNSLTSGNTYSITGNLQTTGLLSLGGVGQPSRITLVVNGDAYLNSQTIKYANYNYVSGVTDVGSIPQFRLIVKGNIFIDQNVLVMDGVYVAQKGGVNTGGIYTCSQGFQYLTYTSGDTGPYSLQDSNYYTKCSNQLTIEGALSADHIKFNRSHGNMKSTPSADNLPAEKIVYSPELWLGSVRGVSVGAGPFDAITNLPPIL